MAVVGCEGGFSETELAHLQAFGYKLMTLSNYVLRAETAVTAACALINYERLKTNRKVSNIVT